MDRVDRVDRFPQQETPTLFLTMYTLPQTPQTARCLTCDHAGAASTGTRFRRSVDAPTGVMTPALLDGLREHKAALLALLQAPPARVPVSRCTRIGPHNPIKQCDPVTRVVEWHCSVCNVLTAPSTGGALWT